MSVAASIPLRKPSPVEPFYCIIGHAGAGYHSKHYENRHREVLENALSLGASILRNGGTAQHAALMAGKFLEDADLCNAGYGSNLTLDGVVEGDALVLDEHCRSGAVGCIPSEYIQSSI